jgi:hypothetical protein
MAWKIPGVGRGLSAWVLSLTLGASLSTVSPASAAPSRAKGRVATAPASPRPVSPTPAGAASAGATSGTATSAGAASTTPAPTPSGARSTATPRAVTVARPAPAKAPSVASTPAEAAVAAPQGKPASDVIRTEEQRAGEKTYTFGAQEVEGRLKSPQILYFLRRVRAQFDPAPLGHRSFLLELSDTRRHPALR